MKRTIVCIVLATCAIMLVTAQGNNRRQNWHHGEPPHHARDFSRNAFPRQIPARPAPAGDARLRHDQRPAPESVSINGNLAIVRGMIGINSGGVTYIAGGLNRFIGFIDGFREGASVTLEGSAFSVPQDDTIKFLRVQKMTLNGKDYEIAAPRQNPAPNPRPMPPPPPPKPPRGR